MFSSEAPASQYEASRPYLDSTIVSLKGDLQPGSHLNSPFERRGKKPKDTKGSSDEGILWGKMEGKSQNVHNTHTNNVNLKTNDHTNHQSHQQQKSPLRILNGLNEDYKSQLEFHLQQFKLAAKLMLKEEETNRSQQRILDSSKVLNMSYNIEAQKNQQPGELDIYRKLLNKAFMQLSPPDSPKSNKKSKKVDLEMPLLANENLDADSTMSDYIPTMDIIKLQHLDRIKENMTFLAQKIDALNSSQLESKKSIQQIEMLLRATSSCAYKTFQAVEYINKAQTTKFEQLTTSIKQEFDKHNEQMVIKQRESRSKKLSLKQKLQNQEPFLEQLQVSLRDQGLLNYSLKSEFISQKLKEIKENQAIEKVKNLRTLDGISEIKACSGSVQMVDELLEIIEAEELKFVMAMFDTQNNFQGKKLKSLFFLNFQHLFNIFNAHSKREKIEKIQKIQMVE